MNIIYLENKFIEDRDNIADQYSPFSHTGDGVFDSMLAVDGTPQNLDYHIERFKHDVETVLKIPADKVTPRNLPDIYSDILIKNNLTKDRTRLRTTLVATEQQDTIFFIYAGAESQKDIPLVTCAIIEDDPREAGNILENSKRLDYSRNFQARVKAQALGAEEAILVNTDGNIACGATSNLFIEEDGILITPPLSDGVLAGVTRRKIMEDRDVREESISPERLKNATRAFLTNSFIGLREIQKII